MDHEHVLSLVHRIYGGADRAEAATIGCEDVRLRYEVPIALLPHVERARAIRDRLRDEACGRARVEALCNALDAASWLMMRDRVTLYANAPARAWFAGRVTLANHDGRVRLLDPAADGRLSAALQELTALDHAGRRIVSVEHASGMVQLAIDRIAMETPTGDAFVVQLFAPALRTLSVIALRSCYGLSDLEAAVCKASFDDLPMERTAAQFALSSDAVAVILQAISRKCGARTQAQLMRNLALSAAVV